jgi:hypothetical protein
MIKFRERNHVKIKEYYKIAGSKDRYIFEIAKSTDDFYNNCLVGSHILSMSKTIMNEVMCLAESLGARMWYQDTDSFFICKADLKLLKEKFKEKYDRELEGKDLGQFHNDFCSRDGNDNVDCATESLFIRKKLYFNKLLMKDKSENICYRSTGISPKAIEKSALKLDKNLNTAVYKLYRDLYDGKYVEMDLLDGASVFKFNKDCTVESRSNFKRIIHK